MAITVRKATKDDLSDILVLTQELADFERTPEEPHQTLEDLCRDGGFGEDQTLAPKFIAFIAIDDEVLLPDSNGNSPQSSSNEAANRPSAVGYTLCFDTYSTWHGKTFFMKDLYVRESHRKRGVGKLLFTQVMRYAKETGCKRVHFHVLEWNTSRKFYQKMKAINVTETEGMQLHRVTHDALTQYY